MEEKIKRDGKRIREIEMKVSSIGVLFARFLPPPSLPSLVGLPRNVVQSLVVFHPLLSRRVRTCVGGPCGGGSDRHNQAVRVGLLPPSFRLSFVASFVWGLNEATDSSSSIVGSSGGVSPPSSSFSVLPPSPVVPVDPSSAPPAHGIPHSGPPPSTIFLLVAPTRLGPTPSWPLSPAP